MATQPEPPSRRQTAVPDQLDEIVRRCLEKDPNRRWRTARELARQLERVAPGPPTREARRQPPESSSSLSVDDTELSTVERTIGATVKATLVLVGLAVGGAAAYITNPSLSDAFLYPLLAVIGALPVILLVAAATDGVTRTAAQRLVTGLGSFGGVMPLRTGSGFGKTLGVAVGLFIGAVLSFLLSHGADQLMPRLRFIPHASIENSEWVLDDPNEDWKTYRAQYKAAFLSDDGTESDWQAHKQSLGRGSIRASRTLFGFAVVLGLAGAIDTLRRRYRRGSTALVVAAVAGLTLYTVWYDWEGQYAREMVLRSGRLPAAVRPALPASAPPSLHRLVEPKES